MGSLATNVMKQQATDGLRPVTSLGEGTVKQLQEGKTTDAVDDAVLRLNGHEAVLNRQFSWISALGLAFSITNSWVGYLSCFGQNLLYGGPKSVIFGLIVAFFVQYTITLGVSELSSAYPVIVFPDKSAISPPKTHRFAAFIVGWMSLIAWWLVLCSGISVAAVCTTGLVQSYHPALEAEAWQIWLIYCSVGAITLLPVYIASKKVPMKVQATLYLSLVGCCLWLVVVLAMKGKTQPGLFITQAGPGTSGWSDGTAWLLGISNAMYTFGGTDGAIHISEEIDQPGRRVPQVMGATMFIGLLSSLPLFIALMFCITSLDDVLSSPLASLETVYQVTGSKTATTFLVIWLLVIYIGGNQLSEWVTAGRIAWVFARDGGQPFSAYFAHVSTRKHSPVRTSIAAFVFVCLYGLLYLASTTAFNSIVTSAVLFLNISYVVPQGILLFQGRDKLPAKWLNLEYLGYLCNTFAILCFGVLAVIVCMPPSLPVAIGSMKYTSVSLVGLGLIILSFWFTLGKKFKGPDIDWDTMEAAKVAAILLRSSDT